MYTQFMDDRSLRIRLATADDFLNVQMCARAAYAKYIERINREPAPIVADYAYQIALGQVYVALCASSLERQY